MKIGYTPTLRLRNVEKHFGLKGTLYGKAEFLNPAGSIKDRVAEAMIKEYNICGILRKGCTIIEATSGNTGIALAMLGALHGYRVKITMPEGASEERARLMRTYGAEVILTENSKGMSGAIKVAEEIAQNDVGAVMMRQFQNDACVRCHYTKTAREIYNDMYGNIDAFVAGVGTGATLAGIGRYLRKHTRAVICAVEPKESPVLSGGKASSHGIEGIGAGFIPYFYDSALTEKVIAVSTEEAKEMSRVLARQEGVLVGISSGANLAAAVKLGKENEWRIVLPLCDRGERYFSCGVFPID